VTSRAADIMRKLMDTVSNESGGLPFIEDITITGDHVSYQRLYEGKFVDGRFKGNIRIDQSTHLHGAGSAHAHVYGRNGNELVVVNVDGSASHGSKGVLHARDADALKARGFDIKPGNIVEWWILPDIGPEILHG